MIRVMAFFKSFMMKAQVFRFDDGQINARGVWEHGTESTENISVSIPQPVTGETLKMLPEGEDISDFVTVFVDESENLKTRVQEKDADQLLIKGLRYEVHNKCDWSSLGGFNQYILRRVQNV